MESLPDLEDVLHRFRNWLEESRDELASLDELASSDSKVGDGVGLYQLVEQLTALRHEVKLLTKAARGGEERNEATLLSMQAAIEQIRSVKSREGEAADKAARPLVEALVDMDESMARGRHAIESARQRALEESTNQLQGVREQLLELYRLQPWWRRWLCGPWHRAMLRAHRERAVVPLAKLFDSLLEGYDLIDARLQRTMRSQSIVRMDCVGRKVDPKAMTVVEVVTDPGRPRGIVTEELRPGYYWHDDVFRFAEVKAVAESA